MTISFSKHPEYGDTEDKLSVDMRIDGGKELAAFDVVDAFISFMKASGYSEESITVAFEVLLLEDYDVSSNLSR